MGRSNSNRSFDIDRNIPMPKISSPKNVRQRFLKFIFLVFLSMGGKISHVFLSLVTEFGAIQIEFFTTLRNEFSIDFVLRISAL